MCANVMIDGPGKKNTRAYGHALPGAVKLKYIQQLVRQLFVLHNDIHGLARAAIEDEPGIPGQSASESVRDNILGGDHQSLLVG